MQAEQQADASGELADYLGASVEAAFEAQGYDVRVLTPAEIGKDPELQKLVVEASRGYAEMLTQLRLKLPRQIRKQRQEAGDEMRLLAAKLGVDAVGLAKIRISGCRRRDHHLGFHGFGSAGSGASCPSASSTGLRRVSRPFSCRQCYDAGPWPATMPSWPTRPEDRRADGSDAARLPKPMPPRW